MAGAPGGWIAVSMRDQDGTKSLPPQDSCVYFSTDGTHWHTLPTLGSSPVEGPSVGYGGGNYLIAGSRGGPVVLDSTDGVTWKEHALEGPDYPVPGFVTSVRDRFFYMNLALWGSRDGEQWSALSHDDTYVFSGEIAYGNGVYLGRGNGMQLSSDGSEWHDVSLNCITLPITCVTDPQYGDMYPNTAVGVFFAEGLFHIRGYPTGDPSWALTKSEGELTSTDGVSWQFVPGPVPNAYVAGALHPIHSDVARLRRGAVGAAHRLARRRRHASSDRSEESSCSAHPGIPWRAPCRRRPLLGRRCGLHQRPLHAHPFPTVSGASKQADLAS